MKKLFFITAIAFGCFAFKNADAQLSIRAGINIGSQPDWGPVGYTNAQYYYMPDIDAYYDVPTHQYIYNDNNAWVHANVLPSRFHFDRYHSYKVVVNQPNPWEHNADIRTRYANYRGRHDQPIIRDSHDDRYRNHWHDNGNHYGQDRGHGNNGHGNGNGGHGNDNGHGNGHGNGDGGHGNGGDGGHGNEGDGGHGNGNGGHGHGGH